MPHTIFATFVSVQDAERAVRALLDYGSSTAAISFVLPGAGAAGRRNDAQPEAMIGPSTATPQFERPLDDIPAPDPAAVSSHHPPGLQGHRIGGFEDNSSGLTRTMYVSRDVAESQQEIARHGSSPAGLSASSGTLLSQQANEVTGGHSVRTESGEQFQAPSAGGISSAPTARAAGGGAGVVALGAGLASLLSLSAVEIRGIGLVAGMGALVVSLTATPAGNGAVGASLGVLENLGMSKPSARRIADSLESGHTILSIDSIEGRCVDEAGLLAKYGATFIETL